MKTGREIMMEQSPDELRAYRLRKMEDVIAKAIEGAEPRHAAMAAAYAVDEYLVEALTIPRHLTEFAAAAEALGARREPQAPQAGE